ncbi:ATP-binding cassette domain-containing protein [Clostridium tertium]|uniref:ABC transporter ATP-binding protein n=1 Tax=Clostridium TaxID=1485 RepID=UPI0002DBF92A|nr:MULTISPECIES: ATP-binding cassette domain-containing protein [Clostridium]MDU8964516.1 ATP-binding cassette domain-containing protein [Clostridium sp.]MBU6135818.1 ATP-binding cassette domain-containing protein [Clostridium tertium]MDB1947203.1 ATP-binding cassette domain-containing protein [Clostridium tertium]MDB1954012.1 ATP-binding cassette domain-containing protein [Clostridium tertium]MDB1958290.1 ATP-binding cassette domain-containing protein [Clostridium tertium]
MIKVENLSKEFKSNKKYPGFKGAIKSFFSREYIIKKAVDNISFEIEDGEIVGYIGANGAGKSTTIKMMTGILSPSSGTISINGLIPYEDREKNAKDIGVVFGQRTQLWWDLPLSETFSLLKDIYDVNDKDYKERMEFLNEVLEINEFILSPVRTLSLGQRMRADLAAALLHNPKIIYLDEPTIGLDVVVKEKVRSAIKEINKKYGTTVILTTHDLNDIEELCNRIIIIDNGIKIYDGSLSDIKGSYGYITTIEVQVKSLKGNEKFDINNEMNISKENLEMKVLENKIIVRFNRNFTNQAEIISKIISKFDILDFSIIETSIEEIIKKIYRKEV